MCNRFKQVATGLKLQAPCQKKYKQGVHIYGAPKCKSARINVEG